MAATTSNEDPNSDSALLSLPAELRNRIYEYALTVQTKHGEVAIRIPPPAERYSGNGSVLRLLQTCRQIHEEARAIFYHENTLHLRPSALPSFVASLSLPRLVHVRSLRMIVYSTWIMHSSDPAWVKALLLLPGLRRLRLDLTCAAIYCVFFGLMDEQVRHQIQMDFAESPKNTIHSSLLQLRGLTNLELRLWESDFDTVETKFHGNFQKILQEANTAIGEVVMKPKQDTGSISEAPELEKR